MSGEGPFHLSDALAFVDAMSEDDLAVLEYLSGLYENGVLPEAFTKATFMVSGASGTVSCHSPTSNT